MRYKIYFIIFTFYASFSAFSQNLKNTNKFTDIVVDAQITDVQPMTGIVFWTDNSGHNKTDAISLEFSYMLFNEVVDANGNYDWKIVEDKLNDVASREHQAIFRFRYVYPGYETSVPDYIKNLSDYNETKGKSEGLDTWFPDWTNSELQKFTLDFYTKFANKYDNDPRLAFIQVGFGLWGEYHIYDGPFVLGETFPSKEFQTKFFEHLDTTFINTPYSISVDAADDTYSPFSVNESLKNTRFGLFDDSFMCEQHASENEPNWNFFGKDRYKKAPAGGEFSYYTDYDQQHVLDPTGNFGTSYEDFAANFHISYIIGNDQPEYQTMERIKEASMASGYKFKIVSCKTSTDSSKIEVKNIGIAPIYYDAFITVNGVRSDKTLKFLQPGETKLYKIASGGNNPAITIECDRLVDGQKIQYEGTKDYTTSVQKHKLIDNVLIYPTILNKGSNLNILINQNENKLNIEIFSLTGKKVYSSFINEPTTVISTSNLTKGLYILKLMDNKNKYLVQKFVVQ